jgi:hypothetical protein
VHVLAVSVSIVAPTGEVSEGSEADETDEAGEVSDVSASQHEYTDDK